MPAVMCDGCILFRGISDCSEVRCSVEGPPHIPSGFTERHTCMHDACLQLTPSFTHTHTNKQTIHASITAGCVLGPAIPESQHRQPQQPEIQPDLWLRIQQPHKRTTDTWRGAPQAARRLPAPDAPSP